MVVSTLKATRKEQVKLYQTYTQANMLTAFPLTTARDIRWWSHWRSLGLPDTQQVSLQDHLTYIII